MADYKELLRRAISALPENNGAARRAVYEKARSALVGQLRAINPPLPARDITQHRLQLEDCIRQVEQEASEANITLGRDLTPPAPRPVAPAAPPPGAEAAPAPAQPSTVTPFTFPRSTPTPPPQPEPEPEPVMVEPVAAAPADAQTAIEDIIAAAESASVEEGQAEPAMEEPARAPEPEPIKLEPPIPLIVNRVEPNRSGPTSPVPQAIGRPAERFSLEARREPTPPLVTSTRPEPIRAPSSGAAALQQLLHPTTPVPNRPVEPALSSVREVEVEPVAASNPAEAEVAIERAIETLDREARGEKTAMLPEIDAKRPVLAAGPAALDEDRDEPEPGRRGAGLTIFLVVFALLLIGAGGAGYWAFNQGYIKLDQMFGNGSVAVAEAQPQITTPTTPTLNSATDTATTATPPAAQTSGPGNTASSSPDASAQATLDGLEPEERLTATPTTPVPSANAPTTPAANAATTTPSTTTGDERLPEETQPQIAANDPAASVDPAVLAGSQSLLLEASSDGKTGAVPFSGTVDWTEGVDEIGLPTLVGKANIPARNLSLDLILRKNADPSLPASHLMEVNFQVSDSFIGGTIAGLPGVLLKNEELVQGTPLVGASARVVGSTFLFALSAADKDVASNTDLLTSRKWIDFAVIYGTGTRAIITLEKDDKAQALFAKVFSAWAAAK